MSKGDDERCPDCGALLILVGRRHLCVPRAWKQPAGRPSIGAEPMTPAQRQRRSRGLRRKAEHVQALTRRPRKTRLRPRPQG
jgi:hypothetical protein